MIRRLIACPLIMVWVAAGIACASRVSADHTATGDAAAADQPSAARAAGTTEHWYHLDVDGTPAGWMLSRETVRDERLTTLTRLLLRFKRAGTAQTFELESKFVETLAGRPLSAWSRQTLGQTPVETTWKFLPHEVLVEFAHGDTTRQQRMPLPPTGWLTPGQIGPQLRQLLADDVRHFTLNSLDPQLGLEVIGTEWILDNADEEIQINGAPILTRRFRQRQDFMPQLETIANVTAEGLTVRSTTPMMGFSMTSTLSRRDQVLESRDAPELLVRTFIYPDRPIEKPRRVRRAHYEILAEEGFLKSLPSVGAQRAEAISSPSPGGTEEAVRVLVDVGSSPIQEDIERADLEPYLRASTFVDHQDAGVRRLLVEALQDPAGAAAERAETLRTFVSGHLTDKNLDSILATAGEVAASGAGDCTEHSVLLTALLRATDIPARAVTGLVYVHEIAGERDLFGYHMWTQAWIGDRWIDLDATLPGPFDAAHIAFGTTALNDDLGTLRELARLATFIGQARIRVLEIVHRPE